MKFRSLVLGVVLSVCTNGYTQNFSTFSGTIRFSGGLLGGAMVFSPMMTSWLVYEGFSPNGYGGGVSDWIRDNHLSFLRFFNAGYDFLFPQWSMSFSNNDIKLGQISAANDNTFNDLFFTNDCYINYIGYYINWRDPFSRFGFFFGADYELRKYSLEYKSDISGQYNYWHVDNEIQSFVPSVGVRYRLISPEKEVDGFPFNVVIEAGVAYTIVLDYKNDVKYSTDALGKYNIDVLNNGFRSQLGIVVTTNKYGSLYLRWTKDFYNLYNNEYIATDSKGYLYNNEVRTNLSCFSIGWATFL